jgi:hypothetical protein
MSSVRTKQHNSVVDELYTKQKIGPASYIAGALRQWLDSFIVKVFIVGRRCCNLAVNPYSLICICRIGGTLILKTPCALRWCRLCRRVCKVVVIEGILGCKNPPVCFVQLLCSGSADEESVSSLQCLGGADC